MPQFYFISLKSKFFFVLFINFISIIFENKIEKKKSICIMQNILFYLNKKKNSKKNKVKTTFDKYVYFCIS
jgi:hypothetical protein